MKLHLNNRPDSLLIHSWALGPAESSPAESGPVENGANTPNGDQRYRIRIADTWYQESLILTPRSVELWDVADVSALDLGHFEHLAELVAKTGAEVVILGAGKRAVFPQVALTRPLVHRQVGLEVMDTAAACRTYNILSGDGRPTVAGLIL